MWNNVTNFGQLCLISANLVSHLSKNRDYCQEQGLNFSQRYIFRETRKKCIGNCSTANVLHVQAI